ncbi:cysteine proteinase [Delitschia confertaspora ATCC 74209]|uniref:Ubiquitin carboxyl-terminal hydrolase n=1 Tax=Delitschia confertaspora ATCC 74209 TaxID=1513339 RepID=A0A9P4MQI0_9PLEO|nr:cysteine proteinase [Delitschia confertaspora ATCC 74209]
MSSFLSRFKSGAGPVSPASSNTPLKKDPNAPQPTPLEKLLANARPIRPDGSDKFFGFENFGSTCYANSIVQCLYYSVPFREHVINFPSRSPPEALQRPPSALPRLNTDVQGVPLTNGQTSALSPSKTRTSFQSPSQPLPKKPSIVPVGPINPPLTKPEDNKDSPEYKKKQAILNGPVLNMDYENAQAYGMSESLFTSLKDIFEAVIAHRSRIGVVSPNKFLEILRRENEMFRTPIHQDAHEFLNYLLNEVVENVEQFSKSRVTELEDGHATSHDNAMSTVLKSVAPDLTSSASNTGWVHELFEGTLTSETRCLTCENTSQRDEAFLDLSVDLEQHSSVTSCLRKFSEEEMLCERNKFHCDNCGGLQEAEKRMKIKRLPKILALHLKRFKYTEDLQRLQKLFHRVVYPYYLRLFNTTDDAEDPDRLYELYAVVVHIGGGPYHGHYVSIIKTKDHGWLLFDDEMVEPVDKAFVRNFFGGENVLACAYILFYQETTFEAMQKEQEAEELAAEKKASETEQDTATVSGKQNGFANGHVVAPTPLHVPDSSEQFASLDHYPTAPPLSDQHPLSNTVASPMFPKLSPKKSTIQLNFRKDKEKKAEEKERKAQEKEAERQAKQQRKEEAEARRENFKKQQDDLRAALEASKATAEVEERRRRKEESTSQPQTDRNEASKENEKEKENGQPTKSALSRFRHTSLSIRGKPKFWGKDKDANGDVPSTPTVDSLPPMTLSPGPKEEKGEKETGKGKKYSFSLGRKKSTVLS